MMIVWKRKLKQTQRAKPLAFQLPNDRTRLELWFPCLHPYPTLWVGGCPWLQSFSIQCSSWSRFQCQYTWSQIGSVALKMLLRNREFAEDLEGKLEERLFYFFKSLRPQQINSESSLDVFLLPRWWWLGWNDDGKKPSHSSSILSSCLIALACGALRSYPCPLSQLTLSSGRDFTLSQLLLTCISMLGPSYRALVNRFHSHLKMPIYYFKKELWGSDMGR